MTKLALLYAGFSWTSYQAFQVLNHLFGVEWTMTPFLIAQRSLSPLMLLLTVIGAIWTLTPIMTGKDQHDSAQQEEQHQRRRWKTLLTVFTLVLIASWILLSGLQVSFKCKAIPLLLNYDYFLFYVRFVSLVLNETLKELITSFMDFALKLNAEQVIWWSVSKSQDTGAVLPPHFFLYFLPALLIQSTVIMVQLFYSTLFLRSVISLNFVSHKASVLKRVKLFAVLKLFSELQWP